MAAPRSGSKLTGACPTRGLPAPPAASNSSPSSGFGSTAISTSASCPASAHDWRPDTAIPIGGGRSRQVPQPGRLDLKVLAPEGDVVPAEQGTEDAYRFDQP